VRLFISGSRRFMGEGVIVLCLVGLFIILKSYGLNPAISDENIYSYDAWLMSRGVTPALHH
jgi:hypothetical protein